MNRAPLLADEVLTIHGAQRAWLDPSQNAANSKAAMNNIVLRMARFQYAGEEGSQVCLADAVVGK